MAGLSLCLLVVVGLVAWSLTDDTYVAPRPDEQTAQVRPALATETLQRLERAVREGDTGAGRALAPDGDRAAERRLAGVVDNAAALRVRDFTLRYVDDEGAPSADGAWSAAVDVTWQLSGFDPAPSRAEVLFRFADTGDRVALTGIGGGGRISPLWLSGPLQVRRTSDTLVLVAGPPAEAASYARRAAAAVPVVRRVLPRWRQGLVVEVPASAAGLDRALDAESGTYDQIAAVTTAADGSQAPGTPVHVFVNPDVFDRLKPTGAQVVISHEATHVATHAYTSAMPLWLLEGFADYVALRDVPLPVSVSAAQIIADVRRDGPPRHLPSAAEFGTHTPRLGATYESAWLACRLLARDGGQRALVAFYRAVDGGLPLGTALRSLFGLSVRELTRDWRGLLSDLAG